MSLKKLRIILVPGVCTIAALAVGLLGALPHERGNKKQNQANQGKGAQIRSEVNLVPVYFTVRDSKRALVTNLTRDQFRVYEDGKEQSIDTFAHESDVPLNVGVLLDTSTRMAVLLS